MATAAAINVTLNANTAQFQSGMNAAGNAATAFGNKAKVAGAGVGQSLQAGAYAFQDFISVMENGGKNALGRAFGAISNNIGTITAGFGPWGMLAGTVGGVVAQLVIPRLFDSKNAIDENVNSMQKFKQAAEDSAKAVAQMWDQKREREADARMFDRQLFNPEQNVAGVGKVMEEMQTKRAELEADLKTRIAQSQQLFEGLSQKQLTGVSAFEAAKIGIQNVNPNNLRVVGTEKYQYSAEEMEAIYTRDGAHTPLGRGLYDLLHSKEVTRTVAVGIDDETKKKLFAAQEEIKKAQELVAIMEKQMTLAKEQKSILGVEETAAQIEAKNKEVDAEVKRHKDLVKSLETTKQNSLIGRVNSLYSAQAGGTRAATGSAAYGSTEAYSAIASATRATGEPDIKELIQVVKDSDRRQLDQLKKIAEAVKEKPAVVDFGS